MKRGPKKRQCEDCKRKKKRCPPDHLTEELPGEESKDEEEGEAEWEQDPYVHIRRVGLPGDLGAGIRDHATGSRRVSKKAKPGEKQTPDPKTGHQSQLKQLEARMKEQLKQIQHQVTCECHPVPTNLLIMAVSLGALASECPQTRAKQLTEINFGSADVGVGYKSTSAGQKQKRADSAEISEQIKEQVGNDSVKHLELLEHMASKFKTNNPEVETDKHVTAALEVATSTLPSPNPNSFVVV